MNFGNVLTAMVTPFNADGSIDFDVTTELIEHLIDTGTDGIVVAGTTGESPTLSENEKIALFKHVVNVVNQRIPVIAGTGNNNTADSIILTKEAEECGVDGIMLVTPYYSRPSQQGLYEHFAAIAKETTLPIMLYNIPGRSSVNMTSETTIRLSEIENIVSTKEASGDLDEISRIIEYTKDDFMVYSGDDSMTLPVLAIGGDGVVSVASHVIGKEMSEIVSAFKNGETKKAADIHRNVLPKIKGLFKAPSPAPVKAALNLSGINVGGLRLPLVALSKEEEEELKLILNK
ncbi:MAG TPA: 4-hydroxy-tetrahydrodipicolinate synthase [Candidatus Dormibacteraeota bacterium]|nr:4-hydroxy-tetrahydrodipicolinate synthase [Candidatus Dormibacteraeota bacterium]